jgi:hypothetical protein
MRKLITWIVVTIGIAALVRKLRGRGKADEAEPQSPPAADPADELREKLASSREPEPEPVAEAEAAPAETTAAQTLTAEFKPVEPSTPEPASDTAIDERRAEVHDEGRAAIDEMRKATED